MAKIIIVDEQGNEVKIPLKEKLKKLAKTATRKTSEVIEWGVENPKEAIAAAATATAAVAGLKKLVPQKTVAQRERERIDTTYYDPSTGLHWRLTRQLNNAERVKLAQAKRNNEPIEEVLSEMGVLAR